MRPKPSPSISSKHYLSLSPNVSMPNTAVTNLSGQRFYVFKRRYFARSALFTAIASSLVGFGIISANAAETSTAIDNVATQSNAQNYQIDAPAIAFDDIDTDDELDQALAALRSRRAVQNGEGASSVLSDNSNNSANNESVSANDNLQQQAEIVQQQGYQMMTPEQIDQELAALNLNSQSLQDDFLSNSDFSSSNDIEDSSATADNYFLGANSNSVNSSSGFNAPIAQLDSQQLPLGLDLELDAATLPLPTNLETLDALDDTDIDAKLTPAEQAQMTEMMSRPIEVSNAVSSGSVDRATDITKANNSSQQLAQQNNSSVTGASSTLREAQTQASTGNIDDLDSLSDTDDFRVDQSAELDPEDYLPDYQASTNTQAVASGLQSNAPKSQARNEEGIVKRLYNRIFNGGVVTLPRVDTTVYLQQSVSNGTSGSTTSLIEADTDTQPMNNIKASLDDTTVQSVADFTAALPGLRDTALNAAKAVGYYDITLSLRQPSADTIDVIIEELGEPVRVDSRIVDIRGEGSEQAEFITLQQDLPPDEGDIFNHRVYKNSKAALEALSNTYGYFDQYWLDRSVDIILPDNTADISLVYDTGARYEFDEVVFFTYDDATGTLTRDPDKLPVELPLLRQLLDFDAGDPFYRPAVTKFTNDLSATRYFNTVNVESILPPDERSANSTLAFDNSVSGSEDVGSDIVDDATDLDDDVLAGETRRPAESGASQTNTVVNNTNGDDSDAADNVSASNTEIVDEADIAPIEFEVDEATQAKLQAIKQKADRLISLPSDRVLDEQEEVAENFLGKISDSISNIAEKIFPEDEIVIDENFVSPTLANLITPEQVLESKKVPLYVFVYANNPRDAQVGLGYGTDTGVRATARIDYNLINRKGYQAGAETEVSSVNKKIAVYGSRPWKHPLNDKLDARLSYNEEVLDQGEGNFDLSTNTLEASIARNIRRENGWNRSYSLRYRLDELETGVDVTDPDDLPPTFQLNSSNATQQALLLGYAINKTTVDNAINPTKGYRQYYGVEIGAEDALSDTDLAIIRAGVSGIYSFGEEDKHQLLGSFNGGYIAVDDFDQVPYNLRFLAGGDQSLRGYDYKSLSPKNDAGYLIGGQVLAIGSAEYNYEFRPGFRGAIFTDIGGAYDKDLSNETNVGVGVGIRWASPVGIVRVDVAAGVTEDSVPIKLHFFIGSPL